jgi:diadenosine tetraphosphate (Ap4A) HIT family hydrolase
MNACPFCELLHERRWLREHGLAVALADAFPLSPGHVLVIPRRHEPDFLALTEEELRDAFVLAKALRTELVEGRRADGFNVGANVGAAGGQTIDHAHLHLIPRYHGDVDDPRGGIRWIIAAKAPYWAP